MIVRGAQPLSKSWLARASRVTPSVMATKRARPDQPQCQAITGRDLGVTAPAHQCNFYGRVRVNGVWLCRRHARIVQRATMESSG